TPFERRRMSERQRGKQPWAPFHDLEEAGLGAWFIEHNLTRDAINSNLKLPVVSLGFTPKFNATAFFEKIDQLPHGPKFQQHSIEVIGDLTGDDGKPLRQELDIWARDPVECAQEILQNPKFKKHASYAPKKVYKTSPGKPRQRVYGEM
ncbi:hypothetical protein BOTBODRAFT_86804, partial [Botryobasidium botryosum FD-172 SS1]